METSAENAEDMQGGGYDIEAGDLPLKHLYQCDRGDWTQVVFGGFAGRGEHGEGLGAAGVGGPWVCVVT